MQRQTDRQTDRQRDRQTERATITCGALIPDTYISGQEGESITQLRFILVKTCTHSTNTHTHTHTHTHTAQTLQSFM